MLEGGARVVGREGGSWKGPWVVLGGQLEGLLNCWYTNLFPAVFFLQVKID